MTRMTRELEPENPLGLNLMRITVDGKPIDDPKRSSADIQRCTDVAFANVDIQFGYDNLRSAKQDSFDGITEVDTSEHEAEWDEVSKKVRERLAVGLAGDPRAVGRAVPDDGEEGRLVLDRRGDELERLVNDDGGADKWAKCCFWSGWSWWPSCGAAAAVGEAAADSRGASPLI